MVVLVVPVVHVVGSRGVLQGDAWDGAAGLKRPERANWLSAHCALCIAVTLHGFISDFTFFGKTHATDVNERWI
jgi:hypothetical protein